MSLRCRDATVSVFNTEKVVEGGRGCRVYLGRGGRGLLGGGPGQGGR